MKKFANIILLGLLCAAPTTAQSAASVHFQDCGSLGSYTVDEVILDLACDSQPCWLPLNKKTGASVSFRSTDLVALEATTQVEVMVANTRKRIQVSPTTCPKDVCPIGQRENKRYSIEIHPRFQTDPIKVDLFWQAFNQKQDQLFCIMFPVIVYNPETHSPSESYLIYG